MPFTGDVQVFVHTIDAQSLNAQGVLTLVLSFVAGDGVGTPLSSTTTVQVHITDGLDTWYRAMTQAIITLAQGQGDTVDPSHILLPSYIRGSLST